MYNNKYFRLLAAAVHVIAISNSNATSLLNCNDAYGSTTGPGQAFGYPVENFSVMFNESGLKFSDESLLSWMNKTQPDEYSYDIDSGAFFFRYHKSEVRWDGIKFIKIIEQAPLMIYVTFARCSLSSE